MAPGEPAVRLARIRTDPEHLGAGLGERLEAVAERARLGGAAGGVVLRVEEEHDLGLAAEVGKPDRLARRRREREVGRGLARLQEAAVGHEKPSRSGRSFAVETGTSLIIGGREGGRGPARVGGPAHAEEAGGGRLDRQIRHPRDLRLREGPRRGPRRRRVERTRDGRGDHGGAGPPGHPSRPGRTPVGEGGRGEAAEVDHHRRVVRQARLRPDGLVLRRHCLPAWPHPGGSSAKATPTAT